MAQNIHILKLKRISKGKEGNEGPQVRLSLYIRFHYYYSYYIYLYK